MLLLSLYVDTSVALFGGFTLFCESVFWERNSLVMSYDCLLAYTATRKRYRFLFWRGLRYLKLLGCDNVQWYVFENKLLASASYFLLAVIQGFLSK